MHRIHHFRYVLVGRVGATKLLHKLFVNLLVVCVDGVELLKMVTRFAVYKSRVYSLCDMDKKARKRNVRDRIGVGAEKSSKEQREIFLVRLSEFTALHKIMQ